MKPQVGAAMSHLEAGFFDTAAGLPAAPEKNAGLCNDCG
jgi:hypothetical protein